MIKYFNDVSLWQKVANNGTLPSNKEQYKRWIAAQLPHYLSELNELDDALVDNDEDETIDGIFDVMWTSLNFLCGQLESDVNELLLTDIDNPKYQLYSEMIYDAVNDGNIENCCISAIHQAQHMIDYATGCGYDIDLIWKIGSASNWAKFAEYKSDALASQKYYDDALGVKTYIQEVHESFVLRVDGLQKVNGKEYLADKIMKCGRVYMGQFVPWIEPDWGEVKEIEL